MGSFANSLHVRCDVSEKVIDAINAIMRDEGFGRTDEQPDEEAMWGMPSPLRAIRVSQSESG